MADLSETLSELGRCEASFEDLSRQRSHLPKQIAELEAKAEGARLRIAEQRAAVEEVERAHRECERDLQDTEAQRTKFQAQAPLVKTNAEYTALLHEIDGAGEKISEIETRILEAMEQIDAESARLKEVESEQSQLEAGLKAEIETLRGRLRDVESQVVEREKERDELIAVLPADARARYDRVRKTAGGGTALIVGRSCGRCHRDIPYEHINRVTAGEIHVCGNCGRILIKTDD